MPALNIEFGDEGDSGGVYHSRYDTFEHHSRFVDPGFVYDALLAKTVGPDGYAAGQCRSAAAAGGQFRRRGRAATMGDQEARRATSTRQRTPRRSCCPIAAFELAADPTKTSGAPTLLKPVPKFEFAPLDNAIERLKKSAHAYDDALRKNGCDAVAAGSRTQPAAD